MEDYDSSDARIWAWAHSYLAPLLLTYAYLPSNDVKDDFVDDFSQLNEEFGDDKSERLGLDISDH